MGQTFSASASIINNVVAFNKTGLANSGTGTAVLNKNCVYNPGGINYSGLSAGAGDILLDPKLVSAMRGLLHIQPDSPCVNAGLDSAVGPGWEDMDFQARISGTHVDIGADESDTTVWPTAPVVVRVSPSGVDDMAHDGSSWALAKRTVQAGMDAALSAQGEVWVAAGTYAERLLLHPYVYMYGGFAGGESTRDERDWTVNKSIVDGSGSGDVVTPYGYCLSLLDGLTVRNGARGVVCQLANPSITNNTISGNSQVRRLLQ